MESVYEVVVTVEEFNFVKGPPEAVERYTLYPATADVLAVQDNATECALAWMPVPESEMTAGEFVALLATVTLPVKVPDVDGEKLTCKVAFCPGARVSPVETPLVVYLAPATLTLETVTLEFPEFLSVTPRTPLAPMATFPKLKLEGLVLRSAEAVTPSPLTETTLGALETSLITVTPPETAPAALGENTMLNVVCWPAGIVTGREAPVILNPLAAVLACVTVRFDPPLLDTVTD